MSGDETVLCDRCGELGPLGARTDLATSRCPEFDAICSDCRLVHGPDACDHNETGIDTEAAANGVGSQTATGWGTNDWRVHADEVCGLDIDPEFGHESPPSSAGRGPSATVTKTSPW